MTNGGGVSEADRCRRLTAQLQREISPSQYIQAHTILKSIAHSYAEDPVLVLGGRPGVCRKLAEESEKSRCALRDEYSLQRFRYGFKNAYTSLDVLAWNPA
jgi:ribonucleotide monophosphatase NagD (HAD superfamily)